MRVTEQGRKVSFTTFRKGARGRAHTVPLNSYSHISAFFFFLKSGFIFAFGLLANGAERKPVKHTVLSRSLEAIPFTLDQSHPELSQELAQVSGTERAGPGYQPVSSAGPVYPESLHVVSRGCPAACDWSASPAREQKVFR